MIFLIESIVKEFGFSKNDIFLGVLPMGHTAIINYQLLPCINVSATIIITHNFNTIRANLWDVISDNQVTNLQIVPTILFGMLMTPYDKSKIMNALGAKSDSEIQIVEKDACSEIHSRSINYISTINTSNALSKFSTNFSKNY